MYQPFTIANFSTGLDKAREPFLLPNDAFYSLKDGYVYKGVLEKRQGFIDYANGGVGGAPICDSRLVQFVSNSSTGRTNNGSTLTNFTLANTPVRRGDVVISDGVTDHRDNGLGSFPTATGTIDYATGLVSGFQFPAASGNAVTASYNFHPNEPVMGFCSYYTDDDAFRLVVLGTHNVNYYSSSLNRLEWVANIPSDSVTNANFWSYCNFQGQSANARIILTNNDSVLKVYTEVPSPSISDYTYTMTADGGGAVTDLKALHIIYHKDRPILFGTTENGRMFSRRIRIPAPNQDNFDAIGSDRIDIPEASPIVNVSIVRDDIVVRTKKRHWLLKYTGNDVVPYILENLDDSRGADAPFGAYTYLNKSSSASKKGVFITDGYSLGRGDDHLPLYTLEEIDPANFNLCYAGAVDRDKDQYLIHPSKGKSKSDKVLVTNYEEGTMAVFNVPLSCMGEFEEYQYITWNDLAVFNSWADMAKVYRNWNSFTQSLGSDVTLGGGHNGEVWKLNEESAVDDLLEIRAMDRGLQTTIYTDVNTFSREDTVYIDGANGLTKLNGKTYSIIPNGDYSFKVDVDTTLEPAYTGGGTCYNPIEFEALSKKFNPFLERGQQVRLGHVDFYVSVSNDTSLFVDVIQSDNDEETEPFFDSSTPYKVDCSLSEGETGSKKWYRLTVNQSAKFIQLRIRNVDPLSTVRIHAMTLWMAPAGRLV